MPTKYLVFGSRLAGAFLLMFCFAWGCSGGGLGGNKKPSDALTNLAPFLSVDGDAQISIAIRGKGALRARYQNGSGADVVGTVKCEIEDEDDAKGSRLTEDGVMQAGGSDVLELLVIGGAEETTFKVQCSADGVGSIEYTVLVGIPDLRGLYEIETKLGYGSQLPDFVNNFVSGLACWSDEGKTPYQCVKETVKKVFCNGGLFCSIAVEIAGFAINQWSQVDEWVDDNLDGEVMRGLGKLGEHFKGMLAQHRFITQINVQVGADGKYEAKQRFVKAYCEIDGAEYDGTAVAEDSVREWSNVEDFEVKFDRDSGKVLFEDHRVHIPYKKVVQGCMTRAAAKHSDEIWGYESSDNKAYFTDMVCGTSGWSEICEFIVEQMITYVENSIQGAEDDDLEIESGEAEPRLTGGNALTVRAFTDGKWKITQPYNTEVTFRGRHSSEAETTETSTTLLP